MANLSHKRKVAIRKAVAELWHGEEIANCDDPMTDHYGADEYVAQAHHAAVRRTVYKAGFRDVDQLLRVATRHRLAGGYKVVPIDEEWHAAQHTNTYEGE